MRRCVLPVCLGLLALSSLAACNSSHPAASSRVDAALDDALASIHLNKESLTVPKLGGMKIAPDGRLAAVDSAMNDPVSLIDLSRRLTQLDPGLAPSSSIGQLLAAYQLGVKPPVIAFLPTAADVWSQLSPTKTENPLQPPSELSGNEPIYRALRLLLYEEGLAHQEYLKAGGDPTPQELAALGAHLATAIRNKEPRPEEQRWLIPGEYHRIGARIDLAGMAAALLRLQKAVELALPDLRQAATAPPKLPIEWQTPLGRVRVAGSGDDKHSGDYLLLIDLGGDDVYVNVARPSVPGNVSVVIDLSGNDTVTWEKTAGPGAGIFGLALWADLQGDDTYNGQNLGLGAGLLGAGLLWDAQGNDKYRIDALGEGLGEYGFGMLLDAGGNDHYEAAIGGQGFGGPGGIGILDDGAGDDVYSCGGVVPDQVPERVQRHATKHFISMCQGFSFGIRPQVSGGIGLLRDRGGNDRYTVDIFGQGSAYWFGLGMLVEGAGNDRYDCFEHCQGESLHLGVASLVDWGGDDWYEADEHAQGVGLDRAAGLLYDAAGNDTYHAVRDAQGAGVKPFGVGILINAAGHDHFEALRESQGFSAVPEGPEGFPIDQWPLGVLIDLGGQALFDQPGLPKVKRGRRIQNRQGITLQR